MTAALSADRTRLVAVLAGLNLVLAVAGWLVLVSPQRQQASTATRQLHETQTALAQARPTSAARQPVIRTADLYRLEQAMPLSADEPDLLLALDQLARESGVKVTGLSPGTPAAVAGGYTQLPVTLTLAGSYGSLTGYLHRLRLLVSLDHGKLVAAGRLVSVLGVTIVPAGTGKQETATVSLDAYVYGTVAGATPLPTATGTTTTTTTGG